MTFALNASVRLTVDAQERMPEIGQAIGRVVDLGGGAIKVAWPQFHFGIWHKHQDLEPVTKLPQGNDDG